MRKSFSLSCLFLCYTIFIVLTDGKEMNSESCHANFQFEHFLYLMVVLVGVRTYHNAYLLYQPASR